MTVDARRLVDKLWSYVHVLRDDGVGVLDLSLIHISEPTRPAA